MDRQTDALTGRSSAWSRGRIALVSALTVLAVGIAVGWFTLQGMSTTAPEQALVNAAEAAMRGDADAVAASVDTSSLVGSAVDDVFSDADERRALISLYLEKHPGVTRDEIKLKAQGLLDEEMREHVEAGTLPKRIPLGNESLKALAAKALAKRSVRDVRIEGDVAHVTATVPFKGKVLTVKVRMKRSGATWKVDRVENLADVLDQAGY